MSDINSLDKNEIKNLLKKGWHFTKEFEFSASHYFVTLQNLIRLAEELLKNYSAVSTSICIGIIEGLGHIKYTKLKNKERFQRIIVEYGKQSQKFNEEFLPLFWKLYRNKLVHEWGMPNIYFKEVEGGFSKKSLLDLSTDLKPKKEDITEITIIAPTKIIEIAKNCVEGMKKELDPIETSVFIHRVYSIEKSDEINYIRDKNERGR